VQFPGPTHRNIYVRSERAGQRVMESITRFITQRLKLKVNETKSAVARPQERKFLGFSFSPTSTVGSEFFVVFVDKPFVPCNISLSALNSDEYIEYFT